MDGACVTALACANGELALWRLLANEDHDNASVSTQLMCADAADDGMRLSVVSGVLQQGPLAMPIFRTEHGHDHLHPAVPPPRSQDYVPGLLHRQP